MERDRKHQGLPRLPPTWLIGVGVREYREIERGDRMPTLEVYRPISELYGWPRTFVTHPDTLADSANM